jgi:hypothetical protein
MWPWDETASDFFAIVMSSGWAREKAGIYWFCPIRDGQGRITGEAGSIPVRQIAHPLIKRPRSMFSWAQPAKLAMPAPPTPSYVTMPYHYPIARMDLMITGGRHELLPWDCGTVDKLSRKLLARELRRFVGF